MDKLLDLTRDFDAAKAAFEAYLDEYDRADDKIHLKIVHTAIRWSFLLEMHIKMVH